MRAFPMLIASVAMGLLAGDAHAGAAEDASGASSVTLARHRTTNALDGPLALADWYTVLRGALEERVTHDFGATRIAAQFELRRFDTYDIEDDAVFAIAAETTARPSDTVELRGTLSLKFVDDGDDLAVGDFIVGTRTSKVILAAAAQAGIRLAPDVTLVLEGSAAREQAGDTRFQDNVLMPARLEPDRDRLGVGATLTRTRGPFSYGAGAAASWLHAGPAGLTSDFVLGQYSARLQGAVALANGASVGAAAGVEMLRLIGEDFSQARPTFELTAATPLPGGFSLRGSLRGGYDTASADDPLASWVRRAEVETGYRASPALRLGAGLFAERRDNLALGNRTSARGVYGEAAWQAGKRLALVFRVDAVRRDVSFPAANWRVIDAQVAITTRL